MLPGFYFGSYGSLIVLKHLVGGPVEPTVFVRMFMAVGILLGIVCIASVSIVIGSIIGTTLGYLVELVTAPAETRKPAEGHNQGRVKLLEQSKKERKHSSFFLLYCTIKCAIFN